MHRLSLAETGHCVTSGDRAGEAGKRDESERDFFFHHVPFFYLLNFVQFTYFAYFMLFS